MMPSWSPASPPRSRSRNAGTELTILDGCELVAIATPTASHLGYLQALQERAVLCEKPLGLTPDNEAEFAKLPADGLCACVTHFLLQTAQELTARVRRGELGQLPPISLVVMASTQSPIPRVRSSGLSPKMWSTPLLYTLFDEFEFQGVRAG